MHKLTMENEFQFNKINPLSSFTQEFNNIININYLSRYNIFLS